MKPKTLLLSAVAVLALVLLMWRSNRPAPPGPDQQTAKPTPSSATMAAAKPKPTGAGGALATLPAPAPSPAVIIPRETNNTLIAHQSLPGNSPKLRVPGAPISATVTLDGKPLTLGVNQLGQFPRLYVAPNALIPVTLHYPNAQPGERVLAAAMDGGRFANSQTGIPLLLDPAGTASFAFQVTGMPGTHRVHVSKGRDVKVLDFWVGPDNAFVKR